jgi:TetR/AcrR family transcriptional repressor of uid operon
LSRRRTPRGDLETALSVVLGSLAIESLLERAYSESVEQVDDVDETRASILDTAYEQFRRMGVSRCGCGR